VGVKVELTQGKKFVEVTQFKEKMYRTFSIHSMKGVAHINLNEDEWMALLNAMPEVDLQMCPGPLVPCEDCKSEMKFVKLFDGRLKPTEITNDELQSIHEHNKTVENQLGILCDYCGVQRGFDCHCHRVNCRDCSPECFCNSCGSCMYYVY
jgi:hypothetical protein